MPRPVIAGKRRKHSPATVERYPKWYADGPVDADGPVASATAQDARSEQDCGAEQPGERKEEGDHFR